MSAFRSGVKILGQVSRNQGRGFLQVRSYSDDRHSACNRCLQDDWPSIHSERAETPSPQPRTSRSLLSLFRRETSPQPQQQNLCTAEKEDSGSSSWFSFLRRKEKRPKPPLETCRLEQCRRKKQGLEPLEWQPDVELVTQQTETKCKTTERQPKGPPQPKTPRVVEIQMKEQEEQKLQQSPRGSNTNQTSGSTHTQYVQSEHQKVLKQAFHNAPMFDKNIQPQNLLPFGPHNHQSKLIFKDIHGIGAAKDLHQRNKVTNVAEEKLLSPSPFPSPVNVQEPSKPKPRPCRRKTVSKVKQTKKETKPLHVVSEKISSKDKASFVNYSDTIEPKVAICKARKVKSESVAHSKVPYHVLAREPPLPDKKLKGVSSKNEMQLMEKSFYIGTSERTSSNAATKAADLCSRVLKGTPCEDVICEKKPSKITQQVPKILSSESCLKPCIEWAKDPPKKETRDVGNNPSEKSPYKIPHIKDSSPPSTDCSMSHSTKSPGTMFFIDQKRLGKPNTFKTKLGVRSASIDCKKAPPPTGRFADVVKGEVSKPASKAETVKSKPKSTVNRSNTTIVKNLTPQKIEQFNIKPSYADLKRAQLLKQSNSANNLVKFDVMKSELYKSNTTKSKESNDPKTTNKSKEMKLWLNEVCRKEEFLRIKESKSQVLGQGSNIKKTELKQTVTRKSTTNAAEKAQKNTSLSDEGKSSSNAMRSITFPAAIKHVQDYTHKTALQGFPVSELKYNMDISKIPKYLSIEPHKTSSSAYMRHQSRASSTGFRYPPQEKASVKKVNNDDKVSVFSKANSKKYEPSPKTIDSSKSKVEKNLKLDIGFPEKTQTPETQNSNKVPELIYKLGNSSLGETVPLCTLTRTLEPVYDKKLRNKPELHIQNLQRDISFMKNQQKSLESVVRNKENNYGTENSLTVNEQSRKSCTKPSPASEHDERSLLAEELAYDQTKYTTPVSKQPVQKDNEQQKAEATKAQPKSAFQPEQSSLRASENNSEQSQTHKYTHQNESPDSIEEHGSKSTSKINQKIQEIATGKTVKFASISETSKHSCPGELYKVPCALLHKSTHELCVQECEENSSVIPDHKCDTESLKDEVESKDLKLATDVETFYPTREKKPAPSVSIESNPIEPPIKSESYENQKNNEPSFNTKPENISSLKVNGHSDHVEEETLNKFPVLNGEINKEKDLQTESICLTEKQTNENNTEQYSVEMKSSYYVNDGAPCSLAEMYIHSEMSNVYYKQEEPPLPTGVNPIAQGTVLQDIGSFGQKQLMRSYSDYRGPNTGTIFIECKGEKQAECKNMPFNKIKSKKSGDEECIQISLPTCNKPKTTICTVQTENLDECKQKPVPMSCYAESIKNEPQEQRLTECNLIKPPTCDTAKKRNSYDGCNPPEMTTITCPTKPIDVLADKTGKPNIEPAPEVLLAKLQTANVGENKDTARTLDHGLSSSMNCSSSTMLINQLNMKVYFPKRYYSQIKIDGISSAHAMECQSKRKGEAKNEKDKCKKLPFSEGSGNQKVSGEFERIKLPGCKQPKSTICVPKELQASECTRIPPPRPSYTECTKEDTPEKKYTECNLAKDPTCEPSKFPSAYDGCNPPAIRKPTCPAKKSEQNSETTEKTDKGKSKTTAKKSAESLGNDISYKLMHKISGVYLMNQMTQKYSFPRRFYSNGSSESKGKADKCKKMQFEIKKASKSQAECLKISLPGCSKPKTTVCEAKTKKIGECKRVPPPLPCYAECLKDPRPEAKYTECNLMKDPTCDVQAKRTSYDGCNPPDMNRKVSCPTKKGEEKPGSKSQGTSPEKPKAKSKED